MSINFRVLLIAKISAKKVQYEHFDSQQDLIFSKVKNLFTTRIKKM